MNLTIKKKRQRQILSKPIWIAPVLCNFILIIATALILSQSSNIAQAQEQRRLALVIGNDSYENIPALLKARNDADAVATELASIGFQVTTAKDIGRRAMSRAVLEFEKTIQPGDLAMFYYAGHGFAVSGQNFLLPVDVPLAGPGEDGLVKDESFLADDLSDRFQKAGATTVVLVLDACRNNPFEVAGKRSINGQAGLARMAPSQGVFVLFSAGIGQSALDRLGDNDNNPNSVFTRGFLQELQKPQASIVDIAKATQVSVRDLAAQVGHVQTPAYYDQIIGTVMLNLSDKAVETRGSSSNFQEGTTVAALPRLDPAPKAGKGKPLVNFSRSNAGWTVVVSLPEPAIQFGYRLGKDGQFTDTGTSNQLDRDTGQPAPVTWFMIPPDADPKEIYITWRDKRGEEAGVFPISFDPDETLKSEQKKLNEQMWSNWLYFRKYNGYLVYFTGLIGASCAIEKIEYAMDGSGDFKSWPVPKCDPDNPYAISDSAKIYDNIPGTTKTMQVIVSYYDGEKSPERNFNIKFDDR